MREIIFLSALALAYGGAIEYNANGCPQNYAVEKLLPHEDCSKFYHCLNGILITRACPSGLYFDSVREICDWPKYADCRVKASEDTNKEVDEFDYSDPSQATKICAAPESNGVLVAHEICNKFYKCSFSTPVAKDCPLNLLYNPSIEQCDWPQNVDCKDRVISEGNDEKDDNESSDIESDSVEDSGDNNIIHDDPSQAPAICEDNDSDGILVAHENCNQFYKCSHGLPVALKCQLNLLFNPPKQYCDWPQNVDCGNRIIPENDNVNNDKDEDKLSRHVRNVKSSINDDPSKAPSICAAENSDGVLVAHENCNQFYKCSHSQPVALSCFGDLLYNPEQEYCDWPANVDCGNRLILEGDEEKDDDGNNGNEANEGSGCSNTDDNDDPSQAPAICAAEDSDGVLVAHENCNQFYKCFQGKPVALICPLDLLYNPSKQYCDWPQDVDCGDRVIPKPDDNNGDNGNGQDNDGNNGSGQGEDNDNYEVPDKDINSDPSKAPELCAADGSDGVLVAHEICNKFYKCSGGLPVALICQGNLLYNPYRKYCDWPQNVDCGDRTLMQEEDTADKDEEKGDENISKDEGTYDVQAAAVCAGLGSSGVLVAHENCDQFYKCAFGVPVTITCPVGLVYNPHLEVCDWPNNVNCDSRVKRIETNKRYLQAKKAYRFLMKVY